MHLSRSPNRVVFITGAAGELGRVLCRTFSEKGDIVGALVHSNRSVDADLIETIKSTGGKGALFSGDIRESVFIRTLLQEVITKWGRLDIFVHCAAVRRDCLFSSSENNDWNKVLDTNLSGSFFCIREAGRAMSQAGRGQIITIGSGAAYTGRIGQASYSASKRGLIALVQSAAKEWGDRGVQINMVLPGLLPGGMAHSLRPSFRTKITSENALGRSSNLKEISEFIYCLSLMENVSGQVFNLDSRIF